MWGFGSLSIRQTRSGCQATTVSASRSSPFIDTSARFALQVVFAKGSATDCLFRLFATDPAYVDLSSVLGLGYIPLWCSEGCDHLVSLARQVVPFSAQSSTHVVPDTTPRHAPKATPCVATKPGEEKWKREMVAEEIRLRGRQKWNVD